MLMLNVSHAQVLSWTMIKMFFCSFILNLAFLREKRKLKKKKKGCDSSVQTTKLARLMWNIKARPPRLWSWLSKITEHFLERAAVYPYIQLSVSWKLEKRTKRKVSLPAWLLCYSWKLTILLQWTLSVFREFRLNTSSGCWVSDFVLATSQLSW